MSLMNEYYNPLNNGGVLSRSRILMKLEKLMRSRFDESLDMIRNCSCEPHPFSFKNGIEFCEFDFGQRDDWVARHIANSLYRDKYFQIPRKEARTPKFIFAEDGWFGTCELFDYQMLNVRVFESLVTILGEYPHRYNEGDVDVLSYNISNFIVYPDYDFAEIWVKYLSDDQLKFVMKCLTTDKLDTSSSYLNGAISQAQQKIIQNSIYGMSSGITSAQQIALSAKHLLNGFNPKPVTIKDAVEQRAFIMKELNRRHLTIDENPMEL